MKDVPSSFKKASKNHHHPLNNNNVAKESGDSNLLTSSLPSTTTITIIKDSIEYQKVYYQLYQEILKVPVTFFT